MAVMTAAEWAAEQVKCYAPHNRITLAGETRQAGLTEQADALEAANLAEREAVKAAHWLTSLSVGEFRTAARHHDLDARRWSKLDADALRAELREATDALVEQAWIVAQGARSMQDDEHPERVARRAAYLPKLAERCTVIRFMLSRKQAGREVPAW